jgi:hypothetical protein
MEGFAMSWISLCAFRRGTRSPSRHHRPRFEKLENRCVPSTVTNLNDSGPGSLRDAIANTPVAGTVNFQPGLTGTITLTSGVLAISKNVSIAGPSAALLTVSGNDSVQVFNIGNSLMSVLISGLTIAHGMAAHGGGIFNAGTLFLTQVTIAHNRATTTTAGSGACGGDPFNDGSGGGIENHGTLFVSASTLNDNRAGPPDSSGLHPSSCGGGIDNETGAKLTITNSTVTHNSAMAASYGAGQGGGIANRGDLTVLSSTISLNGGGGFGGQGGGIFGPVTLKNTIVAGNGVAGGAEPDLNGPVAQADHNLIGMVASGVPGLVNGQNGNQVGSTASPIDPKLGPLQNNGGPTPTQALLPGSPAIDAGDNAASSDPTDQRGLPRIANGTIDIGAYEVQALPQGSRIFAVGYATGRARVFRDSDGALVTDFTPYGSTYTGGIAVAIGAVNGDGFPDLVTAPTAGNPHVKVYDGKAIAQGTFNPGNPDASLLTSFFAYGLNFNVGANVAVGDISGNGFADIVTGATVGNPQVKVYNGKAIAQHTFDPANPDASLLASFFAYGLNFNVGANVTVGDVNHDGFADVVTGATVGNPQVKVYDGKAIAQGTFDGGNPDASLLASFFAFGLNFNVGAFVAVGDVTGNGFGDVIVGASVGNPQVKVYDGQAMANHTFNGGNPDAGLLATFFAYQLNLNIGASVSAAPFDVGGPADILTGAAQGAPHVRVVKGLSSGIQPPAEHGIDDVPGDIAGGIRVGAG